MPLIARSAFDDFMDAQATTQKGKWFYGRVAGTGHTNPDGSSRQSAIEDLRPEDELQLEPEPDNTFDPNAVKVLTSEGAQIGYLEARLALETVRRQRRGEVSRCFVSNLTGTPGRRGLVFGLLKYTE